MTRNMPQQVHLVNKKKIPMAPLIAIIGCDGSGKSTVGTQTLKFIKQYTPAANAHLGKQQGNIGRSLAQLPIIGGWFGRLLKRKVATVHKSHAKNTTPGIVTALVMYLFTLRRVRRFKKMLRLREQGIFIITDRYPQLQFPRAYDGPDLSIEAQGNPLVRWLAKREYSAFEWMTSYQPDLVIRLNVDLDTACKRKPDHLREALKKKVEVTPKLTFNGAPIVEIDSTQPLKQVLSSVELVVLQFLKEHGFKRQAKTSL